MLEKVLRELFTIEVWTNPTTIIQIVLVVAVLYATIAFVLNDKIAARLFLRERYKDVIVLLAFVASVIILVTYGPKLVDLVAPLGFVIAGLCLLYLATAWRFGKWPFTSRKVKSGSTIPGEAVTKTAATED